MSAALTIALAGHASVGKTSLVSALTRDASLVLGEAAGTTRAHYRKTFSIDGADVLVFVDTPGFEFASRINTWLDAREADARGADGGTHRDGRAALEEFLVDEGVHERHGTERDALRGVLLADVIAYVADVVLPPEGQLVQEVRLLRRAGVPMIGVLNNLHAADGATDPWVQMLRREGIDAIVRLDALRFRAEQEGAFYDGLRVLRPEHGVAIARMGRLRAERATTTRARSANAIAEALVDSLAHRQVTQHDDAAAATRARSGANEAFKGCLRRRERALFDELARIHGFGADAVQGEALAVPSWSGAPQDDLFDPEAFARYGLSTATLAAVGALSAGVFDLFGGHGLGMAVGGLAGAAAGLVLGRRVSSAVDGGRLTVGPVDPIQFPSVLLHRALDCHRQLTDRSHADRGEVLVGRASPLRLDARGAQSLLKLARRCRRHANWSTLAGSCAPDRAEGVRAMSALVMELLSRPGPSASP